MILDITDLSVFTELNEIPLEVNPNYSFNVFMGDKDFTITMRTYTTDATRLTVEVDGERIIDNAPICFYQKNLNYFSNFKDGAFFFLRNNSLSNTEPNFNNFLENDLRLFYGSF